MTLHLHGRGHASLKSPCGSDSAITRAECSRVHGEYKNVIVATVLGAIVAWFVAPEIVPAH